VNTVDIAVGVVLLISGVFALVRGFVHEILAAAGWVLAPLAAFWAVRRFPAVHDLAHQILDKPPYEDYAAGAVIFLVVLIVMSFITHAVARRVQRSALGSTDRALGFAFGLVRGLVLCSLAFMVESWLIPQQPDVVANAKSLPLIERGADIIKSLVPGELANLEAQTKDAAGTAEQLKQAKDVYDKLQSPQPRAPDQKNDDKGPNYDSKGMDRLIENTNGK
jgi:membrane protein required for colicin V production